jgi:hypothetical protein
MAIDGQLSDSWLHNFAKHKARRRRSVHLSKLFFPFAKEIAKLGEILFGTF